MEPNPFLKLFRLRRFHLGRTRDSLTLIITIDLAVYMTLGYSGTNDRRAEAMFLTNIEQQILKIL